jgi:hypothetical protein
MRVFWRRREREMPGEWSGSFGPLSDSPEALMERPLAEAVEIERGVSRAVSISRVAEELRRRGEEVVEIFETVTSPVGRAVLPIHLWRGGEDVFIEVETGPWEKETMEDVLKTAAVLRGSEYSDAVFEILGAYPVPEEIRYFCGQTPEALFQLDLVYHCDPGKAEVCARAFKNAIERHWGLELHYEPEELPLVEELLLTVLGKGSENGTAGAPERVPILAALVRGFGCYAGEILLHRAAPQGSWRPATDWGEDLLVEFPSVAADPIGKARAFLEKGPEDSVAYYVAYALEELNG